jgi:spore maturation protein CgeB
LKITLFGLTLSSSWGNGHATPYRALLRAFAAMGNEVAFFEKDVPYYARRRDFSQCDYCRLVFYSCWDEVRGQALAAAAESDVVIVGSYCPEGARIADEMLALSRPRRVFYDLDTPITLEKLRSGGADYLRREQIPEFDLYLSFTGGAILRELEQQWGARSARALYGCVDPDLYLRQEPSPVFRCDLGYMGTYAADRQAKLDELFLQPACRFPTKEFVLAGSMYPEHYCWPGNVRCFEHLAPGLHPAFYSSCRLTLNITRGQMAHYGYAPSGRFFEAAACGTPILSDWWEGLDQFFIPGEEVAIVSQAEDVVNHLQRDDDDLREMAAQARERTLQEHTGERRARQLLDYLEPAARSRTRSRSMEAA